MERDLAPGDLSRQNNPAFSRTLSAVSRQSKILILTAGHGGGDNGAVSPDGQWIEAREALKLRDAITLRLRAQGVPIITDGNPGENKPLRDALTLLRRPNLLAVEIHFNAGPPTATGVEVLALETLKAPAQAIARATATALGLKLRGGDGGWKPDTAGQHHRLAFCRAGGMILEVCFLSNPADMAAFAAKRTALIEALATTLSELSK